MNEKVAISIGLSLMLAAIGWEIGSNGKSKGKVAVAASGRVANGQIIQVSGDVQLIRSNGRSIRPRVGTRIYPGDRLRTAPTGNVLVQCADLTIQSVSANQNRPNACPEVERSSNCPPGVVQCPHRGEEMAWNLAQIPYIISPRQTKLLDDKPVLRWNSVPGATSYAVSIQGQGVNWKTRVSDTRVVYAGEQPLKPGGRYWLIVEVEAGANQGASSLQEPPSPGKELYFSLLTEERRERIRAAAREIAQLKMTDETKALAIANLYTKNDLIAEAIALLEELVEDKVQTAPIYTTLGDLYLNNLELVPQAGVYYSKSLQLADPEDIDSLTAAQAGLGQVQVALGNKDEAIHLLTLALEGAKRLRDTERIGELEKQLEKLNHG